MPAKEKRFLDALESLFTGAEVDGESGFVNLMRIKRGYFCSIRGELLDKIDARADKHTSSREELFDKLYTFFSRYFCESGSIYFRHLPAFAKTYERVYADGEDVALAWKTRMLYYVKSDVLVRSMPVTLNEEGKPQNTRRFYFDASAVEHKKNNERREFVFAFDQVVQEKHGRVVCIKVTYSAGGVKTKAHAILKGAHKGGVKLTDEQLHKALGVFRRQVEADFFINKDARGFLREQFDLWMYQYLFEGESDYEPKRIRQLQAIRDIAYSIIDFIAQFENELRGAWEKPKFARAVNYVVTLDRLTDATLKKVAKHKGAKAQVAEWRELGLVDAKFSLGSIACGQQNIGGKNSANGDHQFLPLDTKHFKDLKLKILADLGDLDAALDGELVHSENWQALNTLQKRYAGRVKCIYIDPPYNTGVDFEYRDKFQGATWLSLMLDRLESANRFLSEKGYLYLQLDHYADYLGRMILRNVFPHVGADEQTIITWNTGDNISGFKVQRDNWIRQADKILSFPANPDAAEFVKLWSPLADHANKKVGWLDFIGPDKDNLYIEKWGDGELRRIKVDVPSKRIGTVWNDIYSFQYSEPRETESFSFQTQKPENLLRRIIQSCTHAGDTVLDFFAGTGTTPAVSMKLGRKWVAVESGSHFGNFYFDNGGTAKVGVLGRMKIVLSGDKQFTLPNTDQLRNPHLSKDINWEGGGAFKYYALEQYEETLRNAHYSDGEQLELDSAKSPFEQYVFFADDKLAHVAAPKRGRGKSVDKLEVNLHGLYADIDIAESLSNILGKPIRRLTDDSVIFADGTVEKTDPATMTEPEKQHFIALIRPYLWWGE